MTVTVASVSSATTGTLSSAGIGSGLDVASIVSSLMAVESQPLVTMKTQEAAYQAKLTAYGTLQGALSSFQTALATLSSASSFQSYTANVGDSSIFSATASASAIAGQYSVKVSQLAQAQTIASSGVASSTATIGSGGSSTINFQFGTINGGTLGSASASGSTLANSIASSGIAANSLSINGTTISTSSSTTSAKLLAAAINAQNSTTNVSATATTDTGALSGFTTTSANGYQLVVNGVTVIPSSSGPVSAADVDTALASSSVASSLTAAGITVSGTAAGGDLHFTAADGSNVTIGETLGSSDSGGFFHTAGTTTSNTYTGAVSLSSADAITVGGTNPAAAGLTAGTIPNGVYTGASFTQNASQASGSVTINSSNDTLQGIRDAINAANLGVTASIVSDGSSNPYHLIITSNTTGATSSMKISVSGDTALGNLLNYDPSSDSGQKMTQTSAAQSAQLTVNGIAVTSATNTVSEAVQGATLTLASTGSSTLTVASDSAGITTNVNSFITAYNALNSTFSSLTSYVASTSTAGALLGDSTTRQIKNSIVNSLTTPLTGTSGALTSLPSIGITLNKDGTMSVDSTKLQNAITNNFSGIAGLFAAVGTSTDSLVSYSGSTTATKPGSYAVNVSQLATQGSLTGSVSLTSGATITAGINDTLAVTVDGIAASVKLVAGTYSATGLAAQIQSAINGTSALQTAGSAVTVSTNSNGQLNITSNRYGSASIVTASGNAVSSLLGGPTAISGVDVAGTINGAQATGSGQVLTGLSGSATEGLQITINGGTTGDRGTLDFSQGYAYLLNQQMNNYLGTSGLLTSSTTGLNNSITSLQNQETAFSNRLTQVQANYQAQFTALDVTIGTMKTTSEYLTTQLAALAANTSSTS